MLRSTEREQHLSLKNSEGWSAKNSIKRFLPKRFKLRVNLALKFASCNDDPVAPEFIIRSNFLTSNSR
ncbi:hypothetical protein [Leptospira noguchii]|uniref:hypothetical protein n=1 Tax=Leptospira noguchii TaxID=28182 RepID=UPI0012FBDEC2|nr:hypothetical protein [Leptospira noguchii]